MKSKNIVHQNLALFAIAMFFLLSLTEFSQRSILPAANAGISAEFRPLFVQLAGQGETAGISPVLDIRNDGTPDIAIEEFSEPYSGIAYSAKSFEESLTYHASTHISMLKGEKKPESIFAMLQSTGMQMEGSLVYSAPALKNRRDHHRIHAI